MYTPPLATLRQAHFCLLLMLRLNCILLFLKTDPNDAPKVHVVQKGKVPKQPTWVRGRTPILNPLSPRPRDSGKGDWAHAKYLTISTPWTHLFAFACRPNSTTRTEISSEYYACMCLCVCVCAGALKHTISLLLPFTHSPKHSSLAFSHRASFMSK